MDISRFAPRFGKLFEGEAFAGIAAGDGFFAEAAFAPLICECWLALQPEMPSMPPLIPPTPH